MTLLHIRFDIYDALNKKKLFYLDMANTKWRANLKEIQLGGTFSENMLLAHK